MCHLTDTSACEAAVTEIEQPLKNEGDLDFWDLLSDKVVYLRGHWVLLAQANGMGNEEQSLSKLVQDAMQLHSMLEDESTVENKCPTLKPPTLCPPCLLKCYGEHIFIPQGIVKDKGDKVVIKMDAYISVETEYGDETSLQSGIECHQTNETNFTIKFGLEGEEHLPIVMETMKLIV